MKERILIIFIFTAKEKSAIKITLPDGKEVDGLSWKTTPYEVAQGIRYIFIFVFLLKRFELKLNLLLK